VTTAQHAGLWPAAGHWRIRHFAAIASLQVEQCKSRSKSRRWFWQRCQSRKTVKCSFHASRAARSIMDKLCELRPRDIRSCRHATHTLRHRSSSLLTPTTVAGVKRSSASVCVFVCLSARRNQNGWNYNHQTCHRDSPSWVLVIHLILGQTVKGQGHRVTKCKKNIFQAIKWQAWVCILSNAHPLVEHVFR